LVEYTQFCIGPWLPVVTGPRVTAVTLYPVPASTSATVKSAHGSPSDPIAVSPEIAWLAPALGAALFAGELDVGAELADAGGFALEDAGPETLGPQPVRTNEALATMATSVYRYARPLFMGTPIVSRVPTSG
jgi:hypothetical protein